MDLKIQSLVKEARNKCKGTLILLYSLKIVKMNLKFYKTG